jgi:hypothetical protein
MVQVGSMPEGERTIFQDLYDGERESEAGSAMGIRRLYEPLPLALGTRQITMYLF